MTGKCEWAGPPTPAWQAERYAKETLELMRELGGLVPSPEKEKE